MLDDLNRIPWGKLLHAYGTAEDVPGLLRALVTDKGDPWSEGHPLYALFGNIYHQGTVYEATGYAVPFLLELAGESTVPNRSTILFLLSSIAEGELQGGNKHPKEQVSAGVGLYLKLLNDVSADGRELRLAAAHVLSCFPERSREWEPAIAGVLARETEPLARAGLILCLGRLEGLSAETMGLLAKWSDSDTVDEVERLAAAVVLAKHKRKGTPAGVVRFLREAIEEGTLEECFKGLPWDVTAEVDPEELWEKLPRLATPKVLQRMEAAIAGGDKIKASESIGRALRQLFEERWEGEALSSEQRQFIEMLVNGPVWGYYNLFISEFFGRGLPETRRKLAAMLGLELEGYERPGNLGGLVIPGKCHPCERVYHEEYGQGTVRERKGDSVAVDFDLEGFHGFFVQGAKLYRIG